MSAVGLPEAAARVLGAARCLTRPNGSGVEVMEGEWEVRYVLLPQEGCFRLTRIDRGSAEQWEMSAESSEDVARYLMVELAPVARAYRRLLPVVFPTFDPGVAPGWERRVGDQGIDVVQDGRVRAEFPPEDPFGVSRSTDFTRYADVPLDEIARLVLTTTVAPRSPA